MIHKKITVAGVYLKALTSYPGLSVVSEGCNLGAFMIYTMVPWFYKSIFDALTSGLARDEALNAAFVAVTILAAAHLLRSILRFVSEITYCRIQPRFMKDLVVSTFKYTMGHGYDFFSNNFVGSLTRKINRFGNAIEGIHDTIHYNGVGIVIAVFGSLILVGIRNTTLLFIILGWVAFAMTVNIIFAKRMRRLREKKSAKDSQNSGAIADAITNSSNIRMFSTAPHEVNILKTIAEELRILRTKNWNYNNYLNYSQIFLLIVVEIVAMFFLVSGWSLGTTTIGDIVLVQAVIGRMNEVVWNMNHIFRSFYENYADAKEAVDILNTSYSIKDIPNAKPLQTTAGAIIIKDVKFNYNETRPVLKGINLEIKPGEKVALIGSSGAGKSTIVKLLLRFYDVTGGKILIDGQNIAKVTQESLRNAISMVPQDPLLFHRTLMDNIRYGRRDASDEDVYAAAKKAHCHEFISNLPDGYKTFVGERGIKLSGGERQRVAIARAILKNAPILVLDEATSSLDSESEKLIQQALEELMHDKTVIVIAHRLSTIAKMDRIIVMEDGKIIDEGTHAALIKKRGGVYKKLWSIQAGGFLTEPEEI